MGPGSAPPLRSGFARDDAGEERGAKPRPRDRRAAGVGPDAWRLLGGPGHAAQLPRHSGTAAERSGGGRIRNPFRDVDRSDPVAPGPPARATCRRAREWVPGLRLRFAPASPGMTPGRGRALSRGHESVGPLGLAPMRGASLAGPGMPHSCRVIPERPPSAAEAGVSGTHSATPTAPARIRPRRHASRGAGARPRATCRRARNGSRVCASASLRLRPG
jgi:hypothetical protein